MIGLSPSWKKPSRCAICLRNLTRIMECDRQPSWDSRAYIHRKCFVSGLVYVESRNKFCHHWSESSCKTFELLCGECVQGLTSSVDVKTGVASAFRVEFNRAFAIIRVIARGRDLKKFLAVIADLWVLSVLGSWCSFLTLFYMGFIMAHTVPVIYEKYDDQIDAFAERVEAEFKKQYDVFDMKVLSKIPKGIKDKLP